MKLFITVPFSVFLLAFSVITVLPRFNIYSNFNFIWSNSFEGESSVWCLKSSNNSNLCRFKNICYDFHIKTFLFFLGEGTIIKGLQQYHELQKIQLSSISSHNKFYANLSVVDFKNHNIEKKVWHKGRALLFSRFKPNNIMHTFHDDLLPIFLTLEYVCLGEKECVESYNLIIHDNYPKGPFYDLYKLFSKEDIVILNENPANINHLCFEELLTGLVQDSVFYQYGFKEPQGPVKTSLLTQNDIIRFASFIKKKLKIQEIEDLKADIILISRNKTRKILNHEEVKEIITDVYTKMKGKQTVKFLILDLALNKIEIFIKALSEAEVLVGMHGAEMIFSLFMKPNSVVFELFPHAIQPEIVSFVKPLSEIEGSHICYFSWRNEFKNNSVAHPDAHPLLGGISHLNEMLQQKILNTHEVPAVKCCNDPVYLYHMYQDTWVSSEFRNFFNESLQMYFNDKKQTKSKQIIKKWFFPSTVLNVSCDFQISNGLLLLNWFPPFNTDRDDRKNLNYSLYIKDENDYFRKEFFTQGTNLTIELPRQVGTGSKMFLWISVFYQHKSSPDVYFECIL